ncbi:MAG: beta strand repeat-containing protein [Lacipirellulaceae bacterium]
MASLCARLPLAAFLAAVATLAPPALALDRTWIGGNVDWVDAGAPTNWNPNDEPDAGDRAIFNTANVVNLGSNNTVNGLALSGGIDLNTNGFDLAVDGLVEVAGGGTNLLIGGAAGSIDADDVVINASGVIGLSGGTLTMDEEVGTALIDINAGGVLRGSGEILFADTPGVVSTILFNDGTLSAFTQAPLLGSPAVGTLTISSATPGFTRVDLDGTGDAGVVSVTRSQTLDLNVGFADAFNGTMNLAHESAFDSLNAWTLGTGGAINVDTGAIDNPFPTPDVPAGTATIRGGLLTQTGGTIDVADTDGTLRMDANFTMSAGSFTNSGTAIFNGATNITTAAGYAPSSVNAQTIVNANVTINDAANDFNWDGNGQADTAVNGSAVLSITANRIDSADDVFGGTITLNDSGDLQVLLTANEWTVAGALNKNNVGVSSISGEDIRVTGAVNVSSGTLDVNVPITMASGSTLDVEPGAQGEFFTTTLLAGSSVTTDGTLGLGQGSVLAGPTTLGGTGLLRMLSTSIVSANTTVNVATFDWDGLGTGTGHTINSGVTFTINSAALDTDGDMDDPLTLAGGGSQLVVNGPAQWTATAAINANNAGVGTATIGGTSRFVMNGLSAVLNVNGDTAITAPLSLGAGSLVDIDGPALLDATNNVAYAGTTISGLGTYSPGAANLVTADSSITASTFDFDGGAWTVESEALLTVNVTDYDATATNAFDGTVTLNSGKVDVTTGDATFVFDGTLNLNSAVGAAATWNGEPLAIGNDAGALDADVNALTGEFNNLASASVVINSDADVFVAAGATLRFIETADVTFNSVNGLNNMEFSGSGTVEFNDDVNVNETTTLNMVGGTVDLDGADDFGDFINIDAPLNINAATMRSFGSVNGGGGANTLDVNNNAGTGVLTVNLDNAAEEWTLSAPGVMNLVNDNVVATLLAGSDVNIDGTLSVTGDVRSTARLDIGATGVVNINTVNEPLRLAGGNNANDTNTIAGGVINGPGVLNAENVRGLHGFGTINAAIDFDGSANLRADNGTLTLNGAITQSNVLGTNDDDGVLNIPAAWNSGSVNAVELNGGVLQGGTITNDGGNGISGDGTVTSRVINNSRIGANGGGTTLVVQTAGNDNDWDGAGAGQLRGVNGATLELRDVGAAFAFTGSVLAQTGGRVFTNGFALDFNAGSSITLNNGAFESTNSTNIAGTVTVGAGTESTIKVQNNRFLTFEPTSATTLNANLVLQNNNVIIDAGATFGGTGALVIDEPSFAVIDNGATVNVLVVNEGALRPGNSEGIGVATVKDYTQTATGELFSEIAGALPNQFDRIQATGIAQVAGRLVVDLDGGFDPALGATFDILTTVFGVSGAFDLIDYQSLPAGKAFAVSYLPNAVRLTTVVRPDFAADFDDDGDVDQTDYAIWVGAYGLNQLGDATGDNLSNAADYTVWRDQLGSGPSLPATSIPEPTAALLVAVAMAGVASGRRRR